MTLPDRAWHRPMRGRDPDETHRASTPLELGWIGHLWLPPVVAGAAFVAVVVAALLIGPLGAAPAVLVVGLVVAALVGLGAHGSAHRSSVPLPSD